MKKIILLFSWLLCMSYASAQTELPKESTDDTGPWYFIKVLGSSTDRNGLLFTAEEGEDGVFSTKGRSMLTESFEKLNTQLWRIEKYEDDSMSGYLIKNKAYGSEMDVADWEEKGITRIILADPSETVFTIQESTTSPGYFQILNADESASKRYLHQGDNWDNRDYCVMLETSSWGNTPDSFFDFVEYEDGLLVSPDEINFGTVVVEDLSEAQTISVIKSQSVAGDISFYILGEEVYGVSKQAGFNELGGTLEVVFEPQEGKNYCDTLVIVCGDAEARVILKGTGYIPLPGIVSPSDDPAADENGDVWYRIHFNQRTYQFLTDMGDGELLEPKYFDADNDGQLWKIVDNGGQYLLESKAGNYITYDPSALTDAGRFIASAIQEHTYSFNLVDAEKGNWQIRFNEATNSEGEPTDSYINKTGDDGYFTSYYYVGDAGSSVQFISGTEVYDHGFPTFSVGTDEHWYMIQFVRTEAAGHDRVLQSEGIDEIVTQSERDITAGAQYWKFVGDLDNCKIINYDGTEMKEAETMIVSAPSGEGNSYQFSPYAEKTWAIFDLTYGESTSSAYFNDNGKTRAGYYGKDAGGEVQLIKVDPSNIITSIDEVDFANDPVVAVTYYNLQGAFVNEPKDTGIYIARYQHESGRYSAKKIFHKAN